MGIEAVLARRRAERTARIGIAQQWVEQLRQRLPLRAAVVFGSVARGDFNLWSDIDLLLVADALQERWLERDAQLGERPPGVQPFAWTPAEWRAQLARRNPIAVEAVAAGVWLLGSAEELSAAPLTPP